MNVVTAKRFTVAEYHRLGEIGFFREDERVELIKGEIIHKAAKSTLNCVCETLLFRELVKLCKLILLPNESVKLPSFPHLVLDLSKVFPG
ncbi:MAG: hypothetical protein ACLBM4_18985 [Dolichospermum sp.]